MKIPKFTAQASLYRTSNSYRSPALDRASPKRTAVTPQIGGPDYKGFGGCIDDCMDRVQYFQPELTHKQAMLECSRGCRDPFAGVDLSTPRNSFNDFLSSAGIAFWEEGCSALVNPGLCRLVANEIRRQS